jgi:hypothetical protein
MLFPYELATARRMPAWQAVRHKATNKRGLTAQLAALGAIISGHNKMCLRKASTASARVWVLVSPTRHGLPQTVGRPVEAQSSPLADCIGAFLKLNAFWKGHGWPATLL